MTDLCRAARRYINGRNPDLTLRQAAILGEIVDNPGQSVGPISVALGLSKPVITRALKHFEALDLTKRHKDESDGRKVIVQPTYIGSGLRHRMKGNGE